MVNFPVLFGSAFCAYPFTTEHYAMSHPPYNTSLRRQTSANDVREILAHQDQIAKVNRLTSSLTTDLTVAIGNRSSLHSMVLSYGAISSSSHLSPPQPLWTQSGWLDHDGPHRRWSRSLSSPCPFQPSARPGDAEDDNQFLRVFRLSGILESSVDQQRARTCRLR